MQTYNQINQGNIMPLLMNFTTPTPIQEADEIKFIYNDGEQISYEMRTIGTRSLRSVNTAFKDKNGNNCHKNDPKSNQIDDSKSVR